jgi:hypothetical protein
MTAVSNFEVGHSTMRDSECRLLQTTNCQSQIMFNVLLYYNKMTESKLAFPEFAPLRPITDITKQNPCITLRGNFSLL